MRCLWIQWQHIVHKKHTYTYTISRFVYTNTLLAKITNRIGGEEFISELNWLLQLGDAILEYIITIFLYKPIILLNIINILEFELILFKQFNNRYSSYVQ